jgi:hypothetical protein
MKDKILQLHQQGKTAMDIVRELGCAYATVRYHIDPQFRQNHNKRKDSYRRRDRTKLKMEFGGKCSLCGYNKCLDALHFHHPDDNKEKCVSHALYKGYDVGKAEALKCQLVCANCHAEIHSKLEAIL